MPDPLGALARFARGRDVAIGYAAIVVVVAVVLQLLPDATADEVVLRSSTNLVNLRLHPPFVLLVSAFVEPSAVQLLLVVPLVWSFGALQRRLGRAPVVITAVLGHVGASLVVSTVLLAGIAHDRIALAAATAPDVGVSYAVVAVLGLLTVWAPASRRRLFVLGGSAVLVGALLADRTFTGLGHLTAWLIGLALALLVRRGMRAAAAPPG